MGKRAILAFLVVGGLVASGQIWLMTALMSRQFASGTRAGAGGNGRPKERNMICRTSE